MKSEKLYTPLPADHPYYRTSSPAYRQYLHTCGPRSINILGISSFGWIKNLFGRFFQIVKYDRIDTEPDIDMLRKEHGLKHGMVIWIPATRTDIPSPWRRLWATTHFQEGGFSIVENSEYYKNWNERARRARKKYLASGVHIRQVERDIFIDTFRSITPHSWDTRLFRSDYIRYYTKLSHIAPESVRSYIAYDGDTPVAGLAVHDYLGNSSVHLVAFTTAAAHSTQAGTGLIDRWYMDSLSLGIKYINFDQIRNKNGPKDQRGYSEFKENFIEYYTHFPDSYFRIV